MSENISRPIQVKFLRLISLSFQQEVCVSTQPLSSKEAFDALDLLVRNRNILQTCAPQHEAVVMEPIKTGESE